MNMKPEKEFDCVEMKRKIQERIHEETKGMTPHQRVALTRSKIANSRFATFLQQPSGTEVTPVAIRS